ncbi:HI0074 family nucleotidyltransferase substrate-binding subunit [Collinsella tanakaei]|uniref:HI0074 family nucleotidyltransferase substrate-binding subunit n=1 Tax=Collinsella tanakaei TaxID=626935 RepID=UPI002F92BFAB
MKKFDNYSSALETLKQAKDQDLENEFVQGGVISKFSLQFELGWKLMKELLKYEGDKTAATGSPREIIKAAYAYYDWMDEEIWLQMLRDRNDTAHIYDAALAERLVATIIDRYIPEFERMDNNVAARYADIL